MKIHAVSLFFLLSILPLSAMDVGNRSNRRPRDEAGEASLKQRRRGPTENRTLEGTQPCPFGEQSEEEFSKWKIEISLQAFLGKIQNCSNGKIYQLHVDPQFKNFFSHATRVMGAAVIQDGQIEILYMKVFPRNGFEESMEIDDVRSAGSWLTLGDMIHATQHRAPQNRQKPID